MFPTATPRRPFAQLELSRLLPRASLLAIAFAIGPTTLSAQTDEAVDAVAVAKIRDEAFNRSQVMMLMSDLTDVHGRRLTASPITRRAAEYTIAQLKS